MPRPLDDTDYIQMALIYALIWEHTKTFNLLDERHVHEMMPRFERELAKRNVEYPPFYPNCVTDEYPEVFNAIVYAMAYGSLELNMVSQRLRVATNFKGLAERETLINTADWPKIFEATKVTCDARNWGKLNDDLQPAPPPAV